VFGEDSIGIKEFPKGFSPILMRCAASLAGITPPMAGIQFNRLVVVLALSLLEPTGFSI